MARFKALVQFSHEFSDGQKMFNENKKYNLEDEALIQAWEEAGYIEVKKEKVKIDKKQKQD
jgi:hypothetical protein